MAIICNFLNFVLYIFFSKAIFLKIYVRIEMKTSNIPLTILLRQTVSRMLYSYISPASKMPVGAGDGDDACLNGWMMFCMWYCVYYRYVAWMYMMLLLLVLLWLLLLFIFIIVVVQSQLRFNLECSRFGCCYYCCHRTQLEYW